MPPPTHLLQIHPRPPPSISPSTWEKWYTEHHLPTLFPSSSSSSSSSPVFHSAALYRATSRPVRSEGIEGTLESLSLHRIRSPSSPNSASREGNLSEEEVEEEGKGRYWGLYRMEEGKGVRERDEWKESLRIPADGVLGEVGGGRGVDEVGAMEIRELEVVDCLGEGNGDGGEFLFLYFFWFLSFFLLGIYIYSPVLSYFSPVCL